MSLDLETVPIPPCHGRPAGSGASPLVLSACRISSPSSAMSLLDSSQLAPTRLSTRGRHGRIPRPFLAAEAGSCFPPRPKSSMPAPSCCVDRGETAPRSVNERDGRGKHEPSGIATPPVLNAEGYAALCVLSPPPPGLQWRREIQEERGFAPVARSGVLNEPGHVGPSLLKLRRNRLGVPPQGQRSSSSPSCECAWAFH